MSRVNDKVFILPKLKVQPISDLETNSCSFVAVTSVSNDF